MRRLQLFSHHHECTGGNTILFLFKKDGKKDQMSVINIGLKWMFLKMAFIFSFLVFLHSMI